MFFKENTYLKEKRNIQRKKKLIQSRKTLKRQKLNIGILKPKFEGTKNLDKKNFYRRKKFKMLFKEEKINIYIQFIINSNFNSILGLVIVRCIDLILASITLHEIRNSKI